MARVLAVRGRSAFAALARDGRRFREGPLTVIHRVDSTPPRVAFAVGRKVGPAVVRNRVRRRLRALWAQHSPPPGDYLLIAGPSAATCTSTELGVALDGALARVAAA